jgi:hypothetical protein
MASKQFRDELLTTTYLRTKDDMLSEVHGLICDSYKQIYDSCKKFDGTNSGFITLHEFRRVLYNHLAILPSHMDILMKKVETDSRGYVGYVGWLNNFSRDYRPSMSALRRPEPEEPISGLARRIAEGSAQRSGTHQASLEAGHLPIRSSTIPPSGPSAKTHVNSITDVLAGRRPTGEVHVSAVREMQLLDEIRSLRLGSERQMELLRDLPVSADKKIDFFRELQLSSAVESSFLTDMRNVDYMRSSLSHTNPVRRSAEHVLRSAPEREMKLISEIRRMPISDSRRTSLLRDLPIATQKKLDLVQELKLTDYVDSVYKQRPIKL